MDKLTFRHGAKEGFPIGLGYFFVAITFGLVLTESGYPFWFPIITSATNLSGTGQFALAGMLQAGSHLLEIIFTVFMVNLRYFLMSVSMSQKLSPEVKGWQRFLIALSVTDENFAVQISKPKVTFPFAMGILLSSWLGWVCGTAVGALVSEIIPQALQSAMGIMLYAMFIAIVVPAAKSSKPLVAVVAGAVALSCLFRFTPVLNQLSSGLSVIVCGLVAAAVGAFFFPVKDESGNTKRQDKTNKNREIAESDSTKPQDIIDETEGKAESNNTKRQDKTNKNREIAESDSTQPQDILDGNETFCKQSELTLVKEPIEKEKFDNGIKDVQCDLDQWTEVDK